MKLYYHTALVTGTGVFPLDMLRYDECWPRKQEDVDAVQASVTRETRSYSVEVETMSPQKDPMKVFAVGRWKSFGASFSHVSTRSQS